VWSKNGKERDFTIKERGAKLRPRFKGLTIFGKKLQSQNKGRGHFPSLYFRIDIAELAASHASLEGCNYFVHFSKTMRLFFGNVGTKGISTNQKELWKTGLNCDYELLKT
jgi:hypothetical protein